MSGGEFVKKKTQSITKLWSANTQKGYGTYRKNNLVEVYLSVTIWPRANINDEQGEKKKLLFIIIQSRVKGHWPLCRLCVRRNYLEGKCEWKKTRTDIRITWAEGDCRPLIWCDLFRISFWVVNVLFFQTASQRLSARTYVLDVTDKTSPKWRNDLLIIIRTERIVSDYSWTKRPQLTGFLLLLNERQSDSRNTRISWNKTRLIILTYVLNRQSGRDPYLRKHGSWFTSTDRI